MMEYLFIIGCWILWPILCYNIAKDKGKNTSNAVAGGLIFGVFAVIYYLLATKTVDKHDSA